MKAKIVIVSLLFFFHIPYPGEAQRACAVSSDPALNTGACRKSPWGDGDYCYSSGSGPACSGTLIKNPQM